MNITINKNFENFLEEVIKHRKEISSKVCSGSGVAGKVLESRQTGYIDALLHIEKLVRLDYLIESVDPEDD